MLNKGLVIGLIQKYAPVASPEDIAAAVDAYLEEHPEISVEDGSITEAKLAEDVLSQLGEITTIKSDLIPIIGEKRILSDDVKSAIINAFSHAVFVDNQGQQYINAIINAWKQDLTLLTGIDAVFTQGSATITTQDSLDDLKQYLVVTGSFVYDGVSYQDVVTDYTLSGNLTTGTSTITVTAGNYTDTFTVNVTQADYEFYTKLIATGNQYIDPDLDETDLERCSFEYKAIPDSNQASSGHILSSKYNYVAFPQLVTENGIKYGRITAKIKGGTEAHYGSLATPAWANDDEITIVAYADENNSVTMNGNTIIASVAEGSSGSNENKYAIFAYGGNASDSGYRFRGKLYYLKIYNSSNVLIHHYIPAKKISTNKCGLFDLVTSEFYSSATATGFTVE